MVVVLAFAAMMASVAATGQSRPQYGDEPTSQPRRELSRHAPISAPAKPFPSDDRGFINSPARCQGTRPASAIGRTPGSLVVICGEQNGRYEYLGVRLSDAALLRTAAHTDSARGFRAQRAGVLYAVTPAELTVTAGDTVIKQEPMIEYREVTP